MNAVCDIGVDINRAATRDHLSPMLAFVAGLGLRKADALKQNIRRSVGTIERRKQLLEKRLLGKVVYNNAAGFLKITDVGQDKVLDPLENTRIHPECYVTNDFAPKICADALDKANNPVNYIDIVEDLMKSVRKVLSEVMSKCPKWIDLWENGTRPIPGVTQFREAIRKKDGNDVVLGVELIDKLFLLDLDSYAKELEKNPLIGKRRLQLEHIKDELRFPWLDLRSPLKGITAAELFTILTGESDYSLYVGLKVGCTVMEIKDTYVYVEKYDDNRRRQIAIVRTDSGMRGMISVLDIIDGVIDDPDQIDIRDHLVIGMHIPAVVVSVKKDKLQVDLSIKPTLLQKDEAYWIRNRLSEKYARLWWEQQGRSPEGLFDTYFNENEALDAYSKYENKLNSATKQMNSAPTVREQTGQTHVYRSINHPLFANLRFKEAEERLLKEGKGAGEVIIRPSSKGHEYLTMTWAFQDGLYKHISILEKGKRPSKFGLSEELYVQEEDMRSNVFHDLDDLYSNYILPMNDLVVSMTRQKFFRFGSEEEVVEEMRQLLRRDSSVIPYFIRIDYKVPGSFVLTWLTTSKHGESINKEAIYVRPDVSSFGILLIILCFHSTVNECIRATNSESKFMRGRCLWFKRSKRQCYRESKKRLRNWQRNPDVHEFVLLVSRENLLSF